jgi:hypothetical protein
MSDPTPIPDAERHRALSEQLLAAEEAYLLIVTES